MTQKQQSLSFVSVLLGRARHNVTAALQEAGDQPTFDAIQSGRDKALLNGILELVAGARVHKNEPAFHLQTAAWTIQRPLIPHYRKEKAVVDAVGIVLERSARPHKHPLTGRHELSAIDEITTFLRINSKPNEALMLLDVLETQQMAQDPESEALAYTRQRRQALIVQQSEAGNRHGNGLDVDSLPPAIGTATSQPSHPMSKVIVHNAKRGL